MFHLRLLGTLQIDQDGMPVRGFDSRKALALLGYLVARGQPVARSHLADLFWPDRSEAQGRASLSRAIYTLSTLLPNSLQANRYTIQFQPDATFWIDTVTFAAFIAQGQPEAMTAAAALYRDDFMTDMALDDCPEVELWLVREREQWRQRVAMTLDTLVTQHSERHEYASALHFATRLTTLEPWREEAHRQVMHLLALSGQRSAALAHYETCRRLLSEELGVEPAAETVTLVEQIRAGKLASEKSTSPISLSPPLSVSLSVPNESLGLHNLPAPLTSFLGREDEITQLTQYLCAPLTRLVTIVGEGGVGKTRLALTLGQRILDLGFEILDFPSTSLADNLKSRPEGSRQNPKFPDGLWFVPLVGVEGGAV